MQIKKVPYLNFVEKNIVPVPRAKEALIYFNEEVNRKKEKFHVVRKIKYTKPLKMTEALINARQILDNIFTESGNKIDELSNLWRFVTKTKKYTDKKVQSVIMPGRSSIAIELAGGEVLKYSRRNPFIGRTYNKNFDIPLIGEVEKYIDNGVDYYVFVQAKADMNITTPKHVRQVLRNIQTEGYCTTDITPERIDQVGIYKGKPYLVDSECV